MAHWGQVLLLLAYRHGFGIPYALRPLLVICAETLSNESNQKSSFSLISSRIFSANCSWMAKILVSVLTPNSENHLKVKTSHSRSKCSAVSWKGPKLHACSSVIKPMVCKCFRRWQWPISKADIVLILREYLRKVLLRSVLSSFRMNLSQRLP